jgi:Pyridoxamine 5'-phosphate oxidase
MDAKHEPVAEPRQLESLTRQECFRLLGMVPFGRVMFTHQALPAICPVTHVVDAELIVIRTSLGAGVSSRAADEGGFVLAYEADVIDAGEHLGWGVVVIGMARRVEGKAERARYGRALRHWVAGQADDIIAIRAGLVTGFRLVPGTAQPGTGSAAAGTAANFG